MDGSQGGYQYPPGSQQMQYHHGYGMSAYNMSYSYYGVQPPLPPGPPPPPPSNTSQVPSMSSYLTPPPPTTNAPPPPPLPPGTTGNGCAAPYPNSSNSQHGGPPPPPPGTYGQPKKTHPPPPPPPGVYNKPKETIESTSPVLSQYPPLMPVRNVDFVNIERPPMPPVFPWTMPVGMTSSANNQYNNFEKDKSLPFVPVVINNAELNKMTETVQKQTETTKGKNLLLYEDIIDEQLPKKLKEMFQPLYCKLCTLTLSSPIVARDHYKGKRHKRAIELWFEQNPLEKKGAPVSPNFIPVGRGIVTATPSASDLPNGGDGGRGRGLFDKKRGPPNDFQNKMGLGASRVNPSQNQVNKQKLPGEPAAKRTKKEKKEANSGPNFGYCNVCQVSLTSQANSDQHYQGKPHKTKVLGLRKIGEFGEDSRFGLGKDFANRPKMPAIPSPKFRFANRKPND